MIAYTKKMIVERVQLHMANNFPSDDSSLSDSQVLLYFDSALAYALVGKMYEAAKVEGSMCTPEAFISTFELTDLKKDDVTAEWKCTLPQTPLSLPLGYNITNAYFASEALGKSEPISLVRSKRVSYRQYMPRPDGVLGWVKGRILVLSPSNGQALYGARVFVEMVATRTDNITDEISASDDVIEAAFQMVIKMIAQRVSNPQDVVDDNLPAGNNKG